MPIVEGVGQIVADSTAEGVGDIQLRSKSQLDYWVSNRQIAPDFHYMQADFSIQAATYNLITSGGVKINGIGTDYTTFIIYGGVSGVVLNGEATVNTYRYMAP